MTRADASARFAGKRHGLAAALALLLPLGAAGQQPPSRPAWEQRQAPASALVTDALDLERDERYEESAETYRGALRLDPANASALLGLERVLRASMRLPTILPDLGRALARNPRDPLLHAIGVRVWVALGPADSVAPAAQRWISLAPDSPDPYREWASSLTRAGRFDEAQQVLAQGSQRVGNGPLLPDLAQLSAARGQWLEAAQQWHAVVIPADALVEEATGTLSRAPESRRDRILALLTRTLGDPSARRMAADLQLAWGRPTEAWALLEGAMPADRAVAAQALERFAERARLWSTPAAHRVRGQALEKLAAVAVGAAAEQARVDAARAYADAGDRQAAERMLVRLAADSARAPTGAQAAMVRLIGMLAESGRVEEAQAQYREWNGRMTYDDASLLRQRIAWAWLLKGDFLAAKTVIADDSSIGAIAIRGWMALFTGDLKLATKNFRAAGPLAGTREQAIQRTQVAGLIQRIEPDSVPEFGRAVFLLARGDTGGALVQLAAAAQSLPPQGGRAEVLFFAGQVAKAKGDHARAQPLLQRVLEADPNGASAPVAEFNLAESYGRAGKSQESIRHLEHLIISYPQSALVPEARRLLEQMRGRPRRS